MLLAALETCRAAHGPDAYLELYGVDISAQAVRLCKLNFALAGIAPNPRVFERDTLTDAPPAIRPALEDAVARHDEQLGLFG